MRKIGQGLQFNAYEEGNKVVKTKTTRVQIKAKLLQWHTRYRLKPKELEKRADKAIKERECVIEEIKRRNINPGLLANLEFIGNRFRQDKVVPLGEWINAGHAEDWIEEYIDFIFECWKNGFSEKTYNQTINNGITPEGKIVLIDFGELNFSKSRILKEICSKRWRKSWSFKEDLPEKTKECYDRKMCQSLTLDNLEKHWTTSLGKRTSRLSAKQLKNL